MSAISDLRGLLAIVERSDWREFYLRTGDWAVFMARPGGGADPMVLGEEPAADGPTAIIAAPHIATFVSALPVGSAVEAGAVVAHLELLGEAIDLVSEEAGTVGASRVEPGALVEYGQPIVEIVAG